MSYSLDPDLGPNCLPKLSVDKELNHEEAKTMTKQIRRADIPGMPNTTTWKSEAKEDHEWKLDSGRTNS